jgi:methylmalonyl-CoA mutase
MIEIVKLTRGAEEIENLRIAADLTGKKPVAFMLTIGNSVMRRARSQFSCNLFGCGGYTVIDNPGFLTMEEGVKAALRYPADIIVICSSDEEYAEYAPSVLDLVKRRAIIVIAGNPASMEDLKSKGIKHFINVRSDLVESLKSFNELLGIR